ncbi:MAG: hypothetical protein QXP01_02130 [Candidatus Hadarchaeum sp.]
MSENPTTSPGPLRVLVVENDPRWRQVHLINLQRWGYESYAAEPKEGAADPFQSLWEDARAKARRYRCHLALVDMRLQDDDDPGDTSGLELVRKLAPTVSIVVSGHGDRKTVREALKSPPEVPERPFDFVAKEDGPEELHRVIMEAVQQHWPRQKIVWPLGLSPAQLLAQFNLGDQTIPVDQAETVLGLLFSPLFPQASRITLKPLDHSVVSANATGIARCAGVLFLAFVDDEPRPVLLVKLGPSRCIQEEVEHYREFVRIGNILSLRLLSDRLLWDIGGAVYDLFAVSLPFKPSLPKLLEALPTEEGRTLLQEVANTLQVWQGHQRPLDKSLFDCYLGEWEQELLQLAQDDSQEKLLPPAPVSWVLKHRDRIPTGLRSAIVHGRLWADSVLVDNDGRVFLTNFEKVGYGYVLQDVALLETDLLICMTSELDHDLFLELAVVMTQAPNEIDPRWMRSTLRVDNDYRTQKIWHLLLGLRAAAFKQIWSPTSEEYLWALLLATVQRMVQMGHEHPDYARAWLLAGVLCERLRNLEGFWPTEALKRVHLLTPIQLENERSKVQRLRQELRLLRFEQERQSDRVNLDIERAIREVETRLHALGLNPSVVAAR